MKPFFSKFRFRRKKQEKDFIEMNKKEKKNFLSNDLVERMIRVEQRVSANFGQPIHYKNTNYYKSLRQHEKNDFEKHLKKNNSKIFVFSILVLFAAGFSFNLTGNVIANSQIGIFAPLSLLLISINFFVLVFLLLLTHQKRSRRKRLNSLHSLIDQSLNKSTRNKKS